MLFCFCFWWGCNSWHQGKTKSSTGQIKISLTGLSSKPNSAVGPLNLLRSWASLTLVIEGGWQFYSHELYFLYWFSVFSCLGHVLADIWALIATLHWLSVSSIRSDVNSVDHALTRYARQIFFYLYFFGLRTLLPCCGGFVLRFGLFIIINDNLVWFL